MFWGVHALEFALRIGIILMSMGVTPIFRPIWHTDDSPRGIKVFPDGKALDTVDAFVYRGRAEIVSSMCISGNGFRKPKGAAVQVLTFLWIQIDMRTHKNDSQTPPRVKRGRALLLGYGLDDSQGHVRYTRGTCFELFGGSDQAHDEMQRQALRIQEEIDRLGFSLDGMTYEQFEVLRGIVERVNCE